MFNDIIEHMEPQQNNNENPAPQPTQFTPQVIPAHTSGSGPVSQVGGPQTPVPTTTYPPLSASQQQVTRKTKNVPLITSICLMVVLMFGWAFLGIVYLSHTTQSASTTNGSQYVHPTLGFKIIPPAGWQQIRLNSTLVAFRSLTPDATDSGFRDVIDVTGTKFNHPTEQTRNLQLLTDASLAQIAKDGNYSLISETDQTISGVPAKLAVFQTGSETVASLFIVSDDTFYTTSGLTSTSDWPQKGGIIQTAVLSFELKQ